MKRRAYVEVKSLIHEFWDDEMRPIEGDDGFRAAVRTAMFKHSHLIDGPGGEISFYGSVYRAVEEEMED